MPADLLCIDGGWGVDALLGHQTRPHSDLDLIIDIEQKANLLQRLQNHHFRPNTTADGTVLISEQGLKLDLHFIRFNQSGFGCFEFPDGQVWPFPKQAFEGSGKIGGITVRCLTAQAQLQCHAQGYIPQDKDIHDMKLLQQQFGLVLPMTFCRTPANEAI